MTPTEPAPEPDPQPDDDVDPDEQGETLADDGTPGAAPPEPDDE